ncbi:MAG: PIN domain-containing protein [Acidimicrobiales bacterium]
MLDTGALIAVERADRRLIRLLELADEVHVPAALVAQAWRNPARQVRLVRVLAADPVQIHALDAAEARAVGHLCGAAGTADFVDASVVLLARRTGAVTVSRDGGDLHLIDPGLEVVPC